MDEAIGLLAEQDAVAADLIKLKFFAGLSLKEAAASLGLTRRQGDRLWAFARAWLFDHLKNSWSFVPAKDSQEEIRNRRCISPPDGALRVEPPLMP